MVQEGEDALEAFHGGGSQPAEIADGLQAFGQNMLEEAVEELLDGQAQGADLVIFAVAVGEGDVCAVIGDNAFGTESGATSGLGVWCVLPRCAAPVTVFR